MAKNFNFVEVDDGDVVFVKRMPFLLACGGDVHYFQIKWDLSTNFFHHKEGGVTQRAIGPGEESDAVHVKCLFLRDHQRLDRLTLCDLIHGFIHLR